MSKYNLSIFDLVEGKEYESDERMTYRRMYGVLEVSIGNSWNGSANSAGSINNRSFMEIKQPKTVTFYRHFYISDGGSSYCSNWQGRKWEHYASGQLVKTDTRTFTIEE